MTRQLLTFGVLATILTLSTVVSAQHYHPSYSSVSNVPVYAYAPSHHHSSTFEEGYLRGVAAYNVSVGQRNLLNSQAAINIEQARSAYIANQQLRTETYFRMKDINEAYKVAHRPTRLSPEKLVELAKKEAPDRLAASAYNRGTGRLSWPGALTDKTFAAERTALDAAFAARSPGDVGGASQFYGKVRELVAAAQQKLQRQISTLSPTEFISAKKFLAGLVYEAQQPAVSGALAGR